MTRVVEALTERLPGRLDRAFRAGANALLPPQHWHIPLTILEGVAATSGPPVRVLVAGPEPAARYWIGRCLAKVSLRKSLAPCALFRLRAELVRRRAAVDLTLVCLDRASARWFAGDDYLMVPEWIGMRAPTPDLRALGRRSGRVAGDLLRVRNGRFTWRLAQSRQAFDAFYASMYLPYVHARHGELAHAHSRARLASAWRHGVLLGVERDGELVAGQLLEREGDVLHLVALGVRDGDEELLKAGASAALYVFAIEYATREGCRFLDFRGTRASLADGVLRYKRKWGAGVSVRGDVRHATWMHWHGLSDATVAWLVAAAPVFQVGTELYGLVVADRNAPPRRETLVKMRDDWAVPGLAALCVLASANDAHAIPGIHVVPCHASRPCNPAMVHASVAARSGG
ncbi:MAG: GNAT family N-acetyltransferase [Casimicrobiaceae bacterium]